MRGSAVQIELCIYKLLEGIILMDAPVQRFRDFFAFYSNEPDRSAAILVPAKLDSQLLLCLQRKLLPPKKENEDPLLRSDRALGTFSSRIEMCYRLGIIDADFTAALHLVRKIRNEFAHGFDAQGFTTPQHKDRLIELARPIRDTEYFQTAMDIVRPSNGEERSQYLVVTGMMTGGLELYQNVVQRVDQSQVPPLTFDPEMT